MAETISLAAYLGGMVAWWRYYVWITATHYRILGWERRDTFCALLAGAVWPIALPVTWRFHLPSKRRDRPTGLFGRWYAKDTAKD